MYAKFITYNNNNSRDVYISVKFLNREISRNAIILTYFRRSFFLLRETLYFDKDFPFLIKRIKCMYEIYYV